MEGDGVVLKIMLACISMMIVFLVWAVFALANKLDGVDHYVRWLERRVAVLECDDDDDDDVQSRTQTSPAAVHGNVPVTLIPPGACSSAPGD